MEEHTEYNDSTAALRVMIQNYMLQLLCLVTMGIPFIINANIVCDQKLKVLHVLMFLDVHNVE
ncbi:hypothetical protein [Bartonella sp. CB74]|uniref:hypothetical protein n=1 Tax=Bartonella sp. CB74 TaxID=3113620 RepID=UPI002F9680F4